MPPGTDIVVQASAIVTATAATGTLVLAGRIYWDVHRMKRVLFGNDDVKHWDGLIAEVRENRRALREEGLR